MIKNNIWIFVIILQRDSTIFNQNWFNTILGFVLSTFVFIITSYIEEKKAKKNQVRNLLIQIIYNHQELFSIIYKGAYSEQKIDYLNLRKNMKQVNFFYLLPSDLKLKFIELYKIHNKSPDYYKDNQWKIHGMLCEIVKMLNEYGDDAFGYK
ncbi:hypothetical protein GOQ29_01115 [Clostridium sp. D2Q-14]|uniref:hypothetical protein n=1 Tax=Anaeromonas gelatinilytica TaxID=2683194 RepID=UPI00193C7889|nr:hypothetical protein [Anaeromonas gelatinilytica]MBS4534211.1 hypothetical protein [Anaeromonas gelatinilytica]